MKKTGFYIALGFSFCLFLSQMASASTWKNLTTDGKKVKIDLDSIQVLNNPQGFDFPVYTVQWTDKGTNYRAFTAADCETNSYLVERGYMVDKYGNSIRLDIGFDTMKSAQGNSIFLPANTYACQVYNGQQKTMKMHTDEAQKQLDMKNYTAALQNAEIAYNEAEKLQKLGYSYFHMANAKKISAFAYSGLGNNKMALAEISEAMTCANCFDDTEYSNELQGFYDLFDSLVREEEKEEMRQREFAQQQEYDRKFQEEQRMQAQMRAQEEEIWQQEEKEQKKREARKELIDTGIYLIRQFAN